MAADDRALRTRAVHDFELDAIDEYLSRCAFAKYYASGKLKWSQVGPD